MSRLSWTRLKSSARGRLVAACAWIKGHPNELVAFATIVALAEVKLTVRAVDGRLDADVRTTPSVTNDPFAAELVRMITEFATDHATSARPESRPAFGDWVEGHGFSNMGIALLSSDANWQDLTATAEIIAAAIRTLSKRSQMLAQTHMGNILARDLPQGLFLRHSLTHVAEWLLAPETNDRSDRTEVLTRRWQAMTIYGALSDTLRDEYVTVSTAE